MNSGRRYTMRARADAVQRTRERVLRAVLELASEVALAAMTLPAIAERAGVSVQTVLRQFGTRDALIDAAVEFATAEEVTGRQVPSGDVDAALRVLLDRYEAVGDRMLLLLAQEPFDPRISKITDHGRTVHLTWLRECFSPMIDQLDPDDRAKSLDLLAVATDLYTWKVLRRDRGLSRKKTQQRMRRLVDAALENGA